MSKPISITGYNTNVLFGKLNSAYTASQEAFLQAAETVISGTTSFDEAEVVPDTITAISRTPTKTNVSYVYTTDASDIEADEANILKAQATVAEVAALTKTIVKGKI